MSYFSVLMPFAIRNDTDQIVSITEVERGNQCNCRCLSCGSPVAARQGELKQWHFYHRTDDDTVEKECDFSPITAIALILRQQLISLYGVNVYENTYTDLNWSVDVMVNGTRVDLYGVNEEASQYVAIEVPFANGVQLERDKVKTFTDVILAINTLEFTRYVFPEDKTLELRSADQIFDVLLDEWDKWIEVVHAPVQEQPPHVVETGLCKCCGINEGVRGKGLLCDACVFHHVGPTFTNLTQMVKHYRSL